MREWGERERGVGGENGMRERKDERVECERNGQERGERVECERGVREWSVREE